MVFWRCNSAVACKIALSIYDDVRIYYLETGSHHPDNERFKKECESWLGVPIIETRSIKYNSVSDVLRKNKFINSPHGAVCTHELKVKMRLAIEKELGTWGRASLGGDFCQKEINRAIRFKQQYP